MFWQEREASTAERVQPMEPLDSPEDKLLSIIMRRNWGEGDEEERRMKGGGESAMATLLKSITKGKNEKTKTEERWGVVLGLSSIWWLCIKIYKIHND